MNGIIDMMFKMTMSKLRALSTLCANFSEVFLASLVIPVLIDGIDLSKLPVILFGVAGTLLSGLFSLFFAEKGKL
jgi:hypothetical protein